jgi:hypothetical protein
MIISKLVFNGCSFGVFGNFSLDCQGIETSRMVVEVTAFVRLKRASEGAGAPGREGFPGRGSSYPLFKIKWSVTGGSESGKEE